MRSPSKLRYVECELPTEVEKTLIAFEDEFAENLKPFYDRLADFAMNDLPLIEAEIEAQIALRDELVKGAPVQGLGSLAAIDATTGLTNPQRDNNDPETIRIDERKLGAAGICLLNGKMFRIIPGGKRLLALRHIWECAGGDYDYFIRLGTNVYTSGVGNYTLIEYNKFTPNRLPFVNRGFTYLTAVGLKISQFKHRMIWNQSIIASYAVKSKMAALGYTSEQINNIFSGVNPNINFDYLGTIADIHTLIRSVTRLIFLPSTDPIRQPPWENEANYIELALKKFLEYRTYKYTTSAIFDPTFWTTFLTELRPADIKELLENRPEILDIELPQDQESIAALVEQATAIGAETTIINTYMNNLPQTSKEEDALTDTLYDLGLAIWKELTVLKAERASRLEALLLELVGGVGPLTLQSPFRNPKILINPSDLSSLFPSANLPPVGQFVAAIQSRGNPDMVNAALAANSATVTYNNAETKTIQDENQGLEQGSTTNNTPVGTTQGLPSEETFAMLLSRRIRWKDNFLDCSGDKALGATTSPSTQAMRNVPELSFEINESEPNNEQWRLHRDNMRYMQSRMGTLLTGDSVSDIRSSMNDYIKDAATTNKISEYDVGIKGIQAKMNTSNDVKAVASYAVEILRKIPETASDGSDLSAAEQAAGSVESRLFSEMSGTSAGAGMYSAKNRNFVESQGGRVPDGLTQSEFKQGLEKLVGAELPFVGKGDNVILPNKGSYSVELSLCQNKSLKKLKDYSRQYEANRKQFESWILKFVNICNHQIRVFQDSIDAFIISVQRVMDGVLAKLERLLTLDLNFSGKIGFENSLFKCSWGIEFGLKVNLLDLLLMYLDRFLGVILGPILKGLNIISDFINKILCIPIRWLEEILNGAAKYMSELLGKIGCSVKDFKLPTPIFELLALINGTFALRSLVLRKGSADWLRMMGRIKLGMDEFTRLSQFGNACASPNLSTALAALQSASAVAASDIPVKASKTYSGVDAASALPVA